MNRTETALLLALVLLVPIGFGSVPHFDGVGSVDGWAGFFAALGPWHLFLALGGALGAVVLLRAAREGTRVAAPGSLVLLALASYAVLQVVPLPVWLQSVVASAAAGHREALGLSGWASISWEPGTTLLEAAKIAIHVAIFLAAARLAHDRRARWWVVGAVVVVAFGEAVYGLLARFALGDTILGFSKLSGGGRVTGTFIDPNHAAALMEVAFPVALALLIGRARRRRAELSERRRAPSLLDFALFAVAAATVAAGVLTRSRAALAALVLGVLVLLWFQVGARGDKRSKATMAVFVVLVAVVPLLLVFGYAPLEERFAHGVTEEGFTDVRFPAWASTLALWLDQPLFGVGIGGYATAIHAYQAESIPLELWYAHNDYLNLLADGGLIGLALGLAFVVIWVRAVGRRIRGPESAGRDLAVGALVAAISVGAHTFFEFNLQIPGVTVPLVALLGVAVAPPREPTGSRPRPARIGFAASAALVLVATALVVVQGSRRAHARAEGRILADRDAPDAAIEAFERGGDALGAGRATLALADVAQRRVEAAADRAAAARERGDDARARAAEARKEEAAAAVARYVDDADARFERAARRRPFRAEVWYHRAEIALRREEPAEAARRLMLSRRFARGRGEVNLQIGKLLLYLSRWNDADPAWALEGADALREAGTLEPRLFTEGFPYAVEYLEDLDDIRRAVPDVRHGRARFATLLERAGRVGEAIELQRKNERESNDPNDSATLVRMLADAGRFDEARPVLHRYFDRAGYHPASIQWVRTLFFERRLVREGRDFFRELAEGRGHEIAETHYWLSDFHVELGEWERAAEAIDAAIQWGGETERFLAKKRVIDLSRVKDPRSGE